jgi:hypothetical protein
MQSKLPESRSRTSYPTDADGANRTNPSGRAAIIESAMLQLVHYFPYLWTGASLTNVTAGRVTGGGQIAWLTACFGQGLVNPGEQPRNSCLRLCA